MFFFFFTYALTNSHLNVGGYFVPYLQNGPISALKPRLFIPWLSIKVVVLNKSTCFNALREMNMHSAIKRDKDKA